MISLSRRSFLGGAALFIASPSIVRAANLMPISTKFIDTRITAQSIADEAAKWLYKIGNTARPSLDWSWRSQKHIDISMLDLHGDLQSVSQRHIAPAMFRLAQTGYHRSCGAPPLIPEGRMVENQAIGSCNGVKVRFISIYNALSDTVSGRFDVGDIGKGIRNDKAQRETAG